MVETTPRTCDARLSLLALVALFVSTSLFSVGCAVGTSALPELPKVPTLEITGSTPSPPRTAFDGSAYTGTLINTVGGILPLTSCTVVDVTVVSGGPTSPPGGTNNFDPFTAGSGLSIGVATGAASSQCQIFTPAKSATEPGVVNVAPGTYRITVRAADSSTPARAATIVLTLVVQGGFVITTTSVVDAVQGRSYTKTLTTNVGTPTANGTLGVAPLSNCSATIDGVALPTGGLTIATQGTTSCLLSTGSGTASLAAGPHTLVVTATDSATPAKNVRSSTFSFTVRNEYSIAAFTVVDGVVNRPYSKTFTITTNLTNNPPSVTPTTGAPPMPIGTIPFGNGPITACSLTGLPAGITGTCVADSSGVNVTATLSGTPTATGAATSTVTITDIDILQSGVVVVPRKSISFNFGFRIRSDYAITPFTVVDGIQGRAYSKTFTVVTNLSNNPVPSEVNSNENGNGPLTNCSLAGLPAGINFTCTIDASGTTATVNLTGTPTTVGTVTSTITLTDTNILQSGATVVAKLNMSFNFSFTIRADFTITPFTVVDGIAGRTYTKTFTITTNLSNNPVPSKVGSSENGNGPITACSFTGLPAGISASSCTVNANGVSVTATLSGIPTTPGTFPSTVTVTDTDILQSGAVVVARRGVSFSFSFTIRAEFSITEPSLVAAVQGRAYVKAIATNLVSADLSDVGQAGEFGNGPIATGGCVETTGNLAAVGLSIGIDPGDAAECLISGTVTSGAGTTISITIAVTDQSIFQAPQAAPVVSANTIMKAFTLSIRSEFAITPFTVVDGIAGRTYNKTFTVSTTLSPTVGNPPLTACLLSSLPAGINFTCTVSGTTANVTLSGTPTTPGTASTTIDLTDSDILEKGGIVVNRNTVPFNFGFTIRSEFSVTEPSLVDGISGRGYSKHINTGLSPTDLTDVGSTTELGNGPAAACSAMLTSGPGIVTPVMLPTGGFTIFSETNGCRLTNSAVSLAVGQYTLVISVTDKPIPQPPQVTPVVPAGTQSATYTFTIRNEFKVTEPALVDGVLGRAYSKHINTSLSSSAPPAMTPLAGTPPFGNGPPFTCSATLTSGPGIVTPVSLPTGGFTIASETGTNGCRLAATPVSLAAGTYTLVISVTDNPIMQLNSSTGAMDPIVPAKTISSISYTFRIRPETTFLTKTVVDAVTGRSYMKTLVTDKNNPNPTGAGNIVASGCTITSGALPTGLTLSVAANSLDCALSGTITAANATYNFTVSAADTALTEASATVVAGSTVSQAYALVVRKEFSFLTATVVNGVAGESYSKLVETSLSDTDLTDVGSTTENGNGPIETTNANGCLVSTDGGLTFNLTSPAVAVTGGTITLSVAPAVTTPIAAAGSCNLTAMITAGVMAGQSVTFLVQATDNPIPQPLLRPVATPGSETVVPAKSVVSGMLTLTVRAPIAIDLASSFCNFSAAGVVGAGTNCPDAVVSRTYADTLVQKTMTGGDPPVMWTSANGTATSLNTTNTACANLTLNSSTGGISSTPTPTTAGSCSFTVTLTDSGIKQATLLAHGTTTAGTMLAVVPPGTATQALSITVDSPMTIRAPQPVVLGRLPDALVGGKYTVTLTALNGLTGTAPVGLPATLTWTEVTTLLGAGACTGFSLVSTPGPAATATISGTPTTPGTCGPFTIQVADTGNKPGMGQFVPAATTLGTGAAQAMFSIVVDDTLGFVSARNGPYVRVIRTDTNTVPPLPNLVPVPGTPQGIVIHPTDTLFGYVADGTASIVSAFCTRVEGPLCPAAFAAPTGVPATIPTVPMGFMPADVAVANAPTTFFPATIFGIFTDPAFGRLEFFQAKRVSSFAGFNTFFGSPQAAGTVPGAQKLSLRPQSDFAWVTSSTAVNTVFQVDINSAAIGTTVPVVVPGSSLAGVAVSPDGRFVYVTDSLSGRVDVIGADPTGPGYRIVVASTPAAGTPGGLLAGAVPHGIRFAPDGRFVYVTDNFNNVVAAIDPATLNTTTATVTVTKNNISLNAGPVGPGVGPEGIALTDDSKKAFVADFTSMSVTAIDTDPSRATIGSIAAAPTGAVRAANVVTITTTTPHGLSVGQGVTVSGVTDASFDGTFVITATPTSTTFTYAQTAANAASGGGSIGTFQDAITTFDAGNFAGPFGVATMPNAVLHILSSLPNAITGRPYSFSVIAEGGTRPYIFSAPGLAGTGLSINAAGLITGAPAAAGTITFTATVTDSSVPVQTASNTFTIKVFDPGAIAVPSPLPPAVVGMAYSQSLDATAGGLAITWSDGGTLALSTSCTGLTLSIRGVLSGTPTTTGTCSFTATISDATGLVTSVAYTLAVKTIALAPFTLGTMTNGRAISNVDIPITGGTGLGITCTATNAHGLTVAATSVTAPSSCRISMMPTSTTVAGEMISITVKDSALNSDTGMSPIVVNMALGFTTTSPLPNAVQSTVANPRSYSTTILTSGGQPLRANTQVAGMTLADNASCAGLSFSDSMGTATISGKPTATPPGPCTFQLQVADTATTATVNGITVPLSPAATSAPMSYSITINPPLAISPTTIPNGLNGSLYNGAAAGVTLSGTGGLGTMFTFSVIAGSFTGNSGTTGTPCQGLTLTSGTPTGTQATISGTLAMPGTCSFTVQVMDQGDTAVTPGTATQGYTVIVLNTLAYVADNANNTVHVINTTSNTELGFPIPTAGTSNPHSVAVSNNGTKAFVTLEGTNALGVIDTATNTVTSTINLNVTLAPVVMPCTGPRGIDIARAGPAPGLAYVACANMVVDVIDTATSSILQTITGISTGEFVAVAPNGSKVYGTEDGSRDMYMITPAAIATASRTANVVTITTTAAHGFTAGKQVTISGVTPVGATNFNGTFTIVATPTTTTFTYMQTAANDTGTGGNASQLNVVSNALATGATAGRGVLVTADNARVYVAEQANSTVYVLPADLSARRAIPLSGTPTNPLRLALSPDTTKVYVSVNGEGTLRIIDDNATIASIAEDAGSPVCLNPCSIVTTTGGGASRTSNVVTITTTTSHGLFTGDVVTISGVGVDTGSGSFNGTFTITAVPSAATFQYSQTAPNATGSGGTAVVSAIGAPDGLTVPPAGANLYIATGPTFSRDKVGSPFTATGARISLASTPATTRGAAAIPIPK